MKDEDIPIGSHFWATSRGELLVILKTESGYQVCGAWECGMAFKEFEFVDFIIKPDETEGMKLYYVK